MTHKCSPPRPPGRGHSGAPRGMHLILLLAGGLICQQHIKWGIHELCSLSEFPNLMQFGVAGETGQSYVCMGSPYRIVCSVGNIMGFSFCLPKAGKPEGQIQGVCAPRPV